jgi:phosphoglycolate phosphatase
VAGAAVLWDLDGTLLRATGTGVRCFRSALATVCGVEWPTARIDFGGRTDPEIAGLLLEASGADAARAADLLAHVESMYAELEDEFRAATSILPAVEEVLVRLAGTGTVQTVVTGNIEPVARRKVDAIGMARHLRLDLGAYGSDHHDRPALVALARQRLAAAGHDVAPDRTWVVGDTPRDLACARANGVRCALVATGTYAREVLDGLGADLVVDDLGAADALVELVTAT